MTSSAANALHLLLRYRRRFVDCNLDLRRMQQSVMNQAMMHRGLDALMMPGVERDRSVDFNAEIVHAGGILQLSGGDADRVPSVASLCLRRYCDA
jgi:hypothetical protein